MGGGTNDVMGAVMLFVIIGIIVIFIYIAFSSSPAEKSANKAASKARAAKIVEAIELEDRANMINLVVDETVTDSDKKYVLVTNFMTYEPSYVDYSKTYPVGTQIYKDADVRIIKYQNGKAIYLDETLRINFQGGSNVEINFPSIDGDPWIFFEDGHLNAADMKAFSRSQREVFANVFAKAISKGAFTNLIDHDFPEFFDNELEHRAKIIG